MSDRAAAFLLVVVYLWTPLRGAERSVSCLLSMPCTLPCPFDPGPEVFINWLKPPDDSTFSVHSFYYESDRLGKQKEEYKGRTQLFKDQIPNGNASLLITRVQLTDKGRYKCYTSTDKGNNEDFINLDLEALVSAVSLSEDGEKLQCVSTNLLPEPSVSWSPEPEPRPETSITSSQSGVWSVHSSVSLPHSPPYQYSCNVSNSRSSWRSATYRLNTPINGSDSNVAIPCLDSLLNYTILKSTVRSSVWIYNQTQLILNQTGPEPFYTESWRERVTLIAPYRRLILKSWTKEDAGLYSCVLTTDSETITIHTELQTTDAGTLPVGLIPGCTIAVVVIVAVAVAVVVLAIRRKKEQSEELRNQRNIGARYTAGARTD